MEHAFEFRDVTNTDVVYDTDLCAELLPMGDAVLVGPQDGWRVCYMEVNQAEEFDGVIVTVYVEGTCTGQ